MGGGAAAPCSITAACAAAGQLSVDSAIKIIEARVEEVMGVTASTASRRSISRSGFPKAWASCAIAARVPFRDGELLLPCRLRLHREGLGMAVAAQSLISGFWGAGRPWQVHVPVGHDMGAVQQLKLAAEGLGGRRERGGGKAMNGD